MRAVVLLSGGLDSATVLAVATRRDGYAAHALSFAYGQRHAVELVAARRVAAAAGVAEHVVADIDLRTWGGSALTSDAAVPTGRDATEMGADIPATYVPARNTIFLAFALSYAEAIDAHAIYIGVNALDYSGYPDCRLSFIRAFQRVAIVGTKAGVEGRAATIQAPLIHDSKRQIIERGLDLGVDYSLTHSCYQPNAAGVACGVCDSCILRLDGFAANGIDDPIAYQHTA